MKPLRELAAQWAQQRRDRLARRAWYPSPAKIERNTEIKWMHSIGVPVKHIARIHGITDIRVRTIVKRQP